MRRTLVLIISIAVLAGGLVLATPSGAETRAQLTARAKKYEFSYSLASFIKTKKAAQARHDKSLDWSDDGCSAPWKALTGGWSKFFDKSCKRHDFGYRNFGNGKMLGSNAATKDKIDNKLRSDMLGQCKAAGKGSSCRTVAGGFYTAVHKSGKAQTSFYKGTCPSGLFCLFDDTSYQDRRIALKKSWSDLNDLSFGDKTSSAKNRSGVAWVIYDDHGYRDRSYCIKPGVNVTSLKSYGFNDKTSAAKRMSSSRCPKGSPSIH